MPPSIPLSLLGLTTLLHSPRDVKLLILARFTRHLAYGLSTLILALYLSALGIPDARIGLFMTLTLAGDVLISLVLTLVADKLGRRRVLVLGAVMMIGSGVVFANGGGFGWLLLAAVVGVISPSGNEIGPFKAVEESTLAHLTPSADRSDVYTWYALLGSTGTACGMMTCGRVVQHLQDVRGWDEVRSYRVIFVGYAALGFVKLCLACALSDKIEVKREGRRGPRGEDEEDQERAMLLPDDETDDAESEAKPKGKWTFFSSLLPDISPESRAIVVNLCVLIGLDAFASGLVAVTWVTYYFKKKFALSDSTLGSIFFVTRIASAISMLIASAIAKRLGNIKTMVFTHVPSALAVSLIPLPSTLPPASALLILRSFTQSMSVAPRTAFLAAVVLPGERTAVMGTINVVKTMGMALGPLITGVLATRGVFWVSFVVAGGLKVGYDVGLLAVFLGYKDREAGEEGERAGAGAVGGWVDADVLEVEPARHGICSVVRQR